MNFVQTEKGICGMSPIGDGYTLCGNAHEGFYGPDERFKLEADIEYEMKPAAPTAARVLTCPDCSAVVLECRGVRISPDVFEEVSRRKADREERNPII